MTRTTELGYLIQIVLLDKGIVEESRAVSGRALNQLIRREVPSYIYRIGEPDFTEYFQLALAGTWNATNPEITGHLKSPGEEGIVRLVCDLDLDPHSPDMYYKANYWMLNGHLKGKPFYCGIDKKRIQQMNENNPLRKIETLGQVQNDEDFWGFVNMWLENNWRQNSQK